MKINKLNRKTVINMLSLLITILWTSACRENYYAYNSDPNAVSPEQLNYDNYGTGGLISSMETSLFLATTKQAFNRYQLTYNLNADIYCGYQGACNAFGNNGVNNTTYALVPGWISLPFTEGFQNFMGPWYTIRELTKNDQTAFSTTYPLAQILKVMGMHRVTDIYGPLPYLNFNPMGSAPYNAQKDIYDSFFIELDSAITAVTTFAANNPSARPLAAYDHIYQGDFSKWAKFANSLKLRLAMRCAYIDGTFGKNNLTPRELAEQAVAAGVLENIGDNAILATDGTAIINPLYVVADPGQYNDTRMGASIESFLKGYKDPRIDLLFNKVELPAGSTPDYHGIRNGSIFTGKSYSVFSTLKVTRNTPVQVMTAAEIYFLRAEGALRGWNMGGTAQFFYEKGVRTAFSQPMGQSQGTASGVEEYLANKTNKPADYVDPISSGNNVAARTDLTVAWSESDAMEKKLERIITQKWIALYPDGQEAWSEFRRTGYPKIFPIPASNNKSGGLINTEQQIRRLPFPSGEYSNNAENVADAVTLLAGEAVGTSKGDNGGTRLWWDNK